MRKLLLASLLIASPSVSIAGAPARNPEHAGADSGFMQLMGAFGPDGQISAEETMPHGEGTKFQFNDGTRLVVKRTDNANGSVSVHALIGHGRYGLPDDLARSSWALTFLPIGGTTSASYAEIAQWLNASGHTAELNFVPELRAFRFSGSSRSADIAYQISLICGIARHAAGGEAVGAKVREFAGTMATQIDTNAGFVFSRAVQRSVSGLGARYSELPERSEITPAAGQLVDQLVEASLQGPLDIAVVGDVAPEIAAQTVRSTCAAGALSRMPRPATQVITSFKADPTTAQFAKVADDAPARVDGVFWSTAPYVTGEGRRIALEVLADVIRARLSVKLSAPGKRVVPIVGSDTGYQGDRLGFFGAGIASAAEGDSLIVNELQALSVDQALQSQVAAVLRSRDAARTAKMKSNTVLAEVLAESLSQHEAYDRLLSGDGTDVDQITKAVRETALWLLNSNQKVLLKILPKE